MCANRWVPVGFVMLTLLPGPVWGQDQPPTEGKGSKKVLQGPPDEEREMLKEIKEAYKPPFEVHDDVLKELRKSYQQPSPDREAKIFKELARLYLMTPEQEAAVLREIRKAYQQPSAEQEARIFQMIQKADPLPPGTVPPSVQTNQARKIFQRLDRNGDGVLSAEEMPDALRRDRARWDANRDGVIDAQEYWAYYQGRLGRLSEQVAAGEIDLKLARGGPAAKPAPQRAEESPPAAARNDKLPAGLPDWFRKLDTDGDGQVGLYEWRASGRPLSEFFRMDRNGDGFITAEELVFYLAQQSHNRPENSAGTGVTTINVSGKP
jgi:Ca2+-binding EF-hand superfamily protein